MPVDTVYLLYGAVFVSTLLLVEGLMTLVRNSRMGRGKENRRMKMLARGMEGRQVLELLRRNARIAEDRIGGRLVSDIAGRLTHAGLTVPVSRFLLIMLALGTLGVLLPLIVLPTLVSVDLSVGVVSLVGGLTAGVVLPYLALSILRKRRQDTFTAQLPDALDIMVRSLEAGHPVPAAMLLVSKEMPDPIGTEFGIAVDEMTYGMELVEVLRNLGRRVDTPEFQYVTVSIGIQSETGGNLSEVLRNLSTIIRARQRMFLKVKALSGEGRVSARILIALPIGTAMFLSVGTPDFYTGVMDDPVFWPAIGILGAMMLAGMLMIHRLVNFKV